MNDGILGIHHITSIASDAQKNIDFYTGVLGLKLVKLTVNFDDPGTYHLYYGDDVGHPGTILTFFPWPNAPKGTRGNGQVTVTSFVIPERSVEFWIEYFRRHGVTFESPIQRFDEKVISFFDPDGLKLELVTQANLEGRDASKGGLISFEHAIRGFYGVTISEEGYEHTASLLTKTLDFTQVREEGNRFRFSVGEGPSRAYVDLLCLPSGPPGIISAGTVHHIAWRTPNDQEQMGWRRKLVDVGLNVTPVLDRVYFRSIYFREPGHVLFEIATDSPGFMVDESRDQLGSSLKLPSWLEAERAMIENALPPVRLRKQT